jgi:hypothetical protein
MTQQLSEDLSWSQIVARAWCDEGLMKRLLSDPRGVLAEHGLEVPADREVKVVEGAEVAVRDDQDAVRYFTLPFSPPDGLSDEDLGAVPTIEGFCGACVACGACARCACRCVVRCVVTCRCF